ncbi:8-oxoguanine DNA glycosylase OGG fold protein [Paractinoplanes atraurantiacus]|uniref:Uncharacterized protein n=1 Tax=Paractinoplanes atraurantiacus TaxID=1036182 RepID=A0A285IXN4_9ACTN|nr:hypothetical protein [Actinoplanes atraurantiacus]SNY52810.1 hypothetical protein SAMN05421748_113102 [Actinoplanes atraurantiacus]
MDFGDARGAWEEASKHRLSDEQAERLAKLLDGGRVRDQAIRYTAEKWPDLPAGVGNGQVITRGDVFDIAAGPALDVFTASYVFGMGKVAYGRTRYDRIRKGAPGLAEDLERVREIGWCQGPVVAYAQLYGGQDYDHRRAAGVAPWSRIASYGPAFFTKFLYFAVPGALILDARLARRVARLTGDEYGYLKNGRPVAWTPYRYAVYLHWMRQSAAAVSRYSDTGVVSPELLELTLFGLSLDSLDAGPSEAEEDGDGEAAD